MRIAIDDMNEREGMNHSQFGRRTSRLSLCGVIVLLLGCREFRPSVARDGEYDHGYKGIPWGTDYDEARPRLRGIIKRESDVQHHPSYGYATRGITTLSNEEGNSTVYFYRFWKNRLAEVDIDFLSSPRGKVRDEIESQYGPPQEETEGDHFYIPDIVRWENQHVRIKLLSGPVKGGGGIELYILSAQVESEIEQYEETTGRGNVRDSTWVDVGPR